jgi:hypothetical protein
MLAKASNATPQQIAIVRNDEWEYDVAPAGSKGFEQRRQA